MKPMTDGEAARQIQAASTGAQAFEAIDDMLRRLGLEDTARAIEPWIAHEEDCAIIDDEEAWSVLSAIEKAMDGFDPSTKEPAKKLRERLVGVFNVLRDADV